VRREGGELEERMEAKGKKTVVRGQKGKWAGEG
jgi:hypothetical protein